MKTSIYNTFIHTFKSYEKSELIKLGFREIKVNRKSRLKLGMIDGNEDVKYLQCTGCNKDKYINIVFFHINASSSSGRSNRCVKCCRDYAIDKALRTRENRLNSYSTRVNTPPIPLNVFISAIGDFFSITYTLNDFNNRIFKSKKFNNEFKTYQSAYRMLTQDVFNDIKMLEGLK